MPDAMDEVVARRWWRGRRGHIAIGVVLVLAAVGALAARQAGGTGTLSVAEDTIIVETAQRGLFHDITPLDGRAVPRDIIYLDALEGGQVQRVLARAGDQVRGGQPLVELRNTQLELDILSQEGRLIESMTQLQAREQQLEQAEAENRKALARIDYDLVRLGDAVDRREQLAQRGFIAREEFQKLTDELDYARTLRPIQARTTATQAALLDEQGPQIRAQLAMLQKSLQITRSKLDELTVRAPMSGRLTALDLKVGQTRNRGDRLGEVTLNTGSKVEAELDQFYLERVRIGQAATVDVHGKPTRLRVTRILPAVQGGRFTIELDFVGGAPPDLLPGEGVRGELELGRDTAALVLPAGAFLEQTGGNWLFVLAPDGRSALRRTVRPGRRSAEQLEILCGLAPGDRVITSTYRGWDNFDRINLTQ
jgi:HlyD family secretion protein